jgi:hypothetical protein
MIRQGDGIGFNRLNFLELRELHWGPLVGEFALYE